MTSALPLIRAVAALCSPDHEAPIDPPATWATFFWGDDALTMVVPGRGMFVMAGLVDGERCVAEWVGTS